MQFEQTAGTKDLWLKVYAGQCSKRTVDRVVPVWLARVGRLGTDMRAELSLGKDGLLRSVGVSEIDGTEVDLWRSRSPCPVQSAGQGGPLLKLNRVSGRPELHCSSGTPIPLK